jgi:hypothetical protein
LNSAPLNASLPHGADVLPAWRRRSARQVRKLEAAGRLVELDDDDGAQVCAPPLRIGAVHRRKVAFG